MDIALVMQSDNLHADMELRKGAPIVDDGLQTAVYMSLFSDAFDVDEAAGGWWGDILEEVTPAKSASKKAAAAAAAKLGSRIWTLARAKILSGIEEKVQSYCLTALQWLKDYKIAESITCTASITSTHNILISIEITQPGKDKNTTEYRFNWDAQTKSLAERVIEADAS
jgi:phage gp46-like protein